MAYSISSVEIFTHTHENTLSVCPMNFAPTEARYVARREKYPKQIPAQKETESQKSVGLK